jgi:hypothetical protein
MFFPLTGGDATITTFSMKNSGFVKSSGDVICNVNFFQEPDGVHCQNPGNLLSCTVSVKVNNCDICRQN